MINSKRQRLFFLGSFMVGIFLSGGVWGYITIDVRENDQDMIIYGAEIHDGLGYPVLSVDLNGDGRRDMVIAATASDGPNHSKINCGAVYVIFGKDSLPTLARMPIDADLTIYGAERGINGIEGDEAGYALAAADMNNDGIEDLIIASIYGDGPANSRPDGGEISIIFGRSEFPAVMDLSTDADVIIYGADGGFGGEDPNDPDKGDMAGTALATGDLNNDGKQDLIIGAVLGDGPNNNRIHAGQTHIVWGSESLDTVIDLADPNGQTILWGADIGDYSGFALYVRDINSDGIDDLMVASLLADGPNEARENCGETYIIYGRDIFPDQMDLGTDADVTIYGADSNDQFFNPVNYIASGDVNGDSQSDLIIGAAFADGPMNDLMDCGEIYVVLGDGPLPETIDLAIDADTIFHGTDEEDYAGFCLAVGDVNGDAMDDILISAPNADGLFDVRTASGNVYVVYGRKEFLPSYDLADADVHVYGGNPFDLMGITTHCADINGDGIDDIMIALAIADGIDNLLEDSGEVIVVYGSPGGLGLSPVFPENGAVVSCQPKFEWTAGRSSNVVWQFELFQAPDGTLPLHASPILLEPNYALPDNFLSELPAAQPLYWKVYGTDPNGDPVRIQESGMSSFTRAGLELLSPGVGEVLSAAPLLEWQDGCQDNNSWIVEVSEDPNFTTSLGLSPILTTTAWQVPQSVWDTLPSGVELYWQVMGYHQPVPWRVLVGWSNRGFFFYKPGAPVSLEIDIIPEDEGFYFTVDDANYSARQSFTWPWGSVHTVSAPATQVGPNYTYEYAGWSDGGSQTHTITPNSTSDRKYIVYYAVPELAPDPNLMVWDMAPSALGPATVSMKATEVAGMVAEYFFVELTGNPGGDDSGWQGNADYTDTGLAPDSAYRYIVTARYIWDATPPSAAWPSPSASVMTLETWDFDGDGWADLADLLGLAARWLEECQDPDWCEGYDIDQNGTLSQIEYDNLTRHWLEGQ